MDDELILLNPGPACTSQRVKDALLRGDLCHREPEFGELLAKIRADLPRALGLTAHEALLVTGSGTSAMEMAVISSVRAGREILVVDNGVYGDRLLKIARANGITAHTVRPDGDDLTRWTTPIDPEAVRAALEEHPGVDAVAVVHHETTTGLINPVRAIGEIVKDTGALLVVDAISATGNEDQDLGEIHADIVCGTANKGLHGLPGISFILCSPKGIERIQEVPARSLYLNAASYLKGQRNGNVPFTPAVQVCYALDEAIQEYFDQGGFEGRTKLYRERAALVRSGFGRLGLDVLVKPELRSNSVTMLHLPDAVTYDRLHDELKRRGYVIYAGQGSLSSQFFRICTMGEIPWHRLEELEGALDESIRAARA
ncbi:pyridoxal-phosphate-dependent aminotransferase family protein [Actinomadura rupiterrae]|uniref:pyridoxal-phosphate-dependent aminotransferase family protein n=1 Tax=Actinomadura rupiterrae TaxID=559627 RepID=UPI0020A38ACB|nr:alanine--glyoxylate aminotransferase family protein [Actinomadura rupiterrae]MCP2334884.1 2-aminoethylphosphonate-pyruvate transaminase [Actinomadura rupiterrae]